MSTTGTSSSASISTDTNKSYPIESVAVLVATLLKANPSVTFNYGTMSALSSLSTAPQTKSSIDHQFRAVKKRALELLRAWEEVEKDGGSVEEVKAAGGRKRAVGGAGTGGSGEAEESPRKVRKAAGVKEGKGVKGAKGGRKVKVEEDDDEVA